MKQRLRERQMPQRRFSVGQGAGDIELFTRMEFTDGVNCL